MFWCQFVTQLLSGLGNGIVIGTSSDVQISNITYRNCVSNRTAYGMHIKFKDNQTGHVSGVLYENITVIQPYRYVIGINQNDQGQRRQLLGESSSEEYDSHGSTRDCDIYHPMVNVSIYDITYMYRNIRTVGGKVLSAGGLQCDVQKHGHEDGVKGPPCTGLTMENIQIDSIMGCEFEGIVEGEVIGSVEPASCRIPSVKTQSVKTQDLLLKSDDDDEALQKAPPTKLWDGVPWGFYTNYPDFSDPNVTNQMLTDAMATPEGRQNVDDQLV